MKTTKIILIIFLFAITGCNKEDHNEINSDSPFIYNVYLELLKADGISFKEGEVEAKGGYMDAEGAVYYFNDWVQLPIDTYQSDILNKIIFGPFEIGVSVGQGVAGGDGDGSEQEREWVSNQLLQLRYQNIEEIDVLRSRDSTNYPEFRYFDIFQNDILIQRFGYPENYVEAPWYITIQK